MKIGAFAAHPELFQRVLALHVGELPFLRFAVGGIPQLGWQLIIA